MKTFKSFLEMQKYLKENVVLSDEDKKSEQGSRDLQTKPSDETKGSS